MPDKRKQLFNETSDVVTQNIQGLCQSNANLNCLDGFPKVRLCLKVVMPPLSISRLMPHPLARQKFCSTMDSSSETFIFLQVKVVLRSDLAKNERVSVVSGT